MHAAQLRDPDRLKHPTMQALDKVERQLTELNIQLAEAARLLRAETGPDRVLHRNNSTVLAALNYYESELRELIGRVSVLRSTLSVQKY